MSNYDYTDYGIDFATSECEKHGEVTTVECRACGMDTCSTCTKCEWCEAEV